MNLGRLDITMGVINAPLLRGLNESMRAVNNAVRGIEAQGAALSNALSGALSFQAITAGLDHVFDAADRLAGRVEVVLRFHQPNRRRRDCGNYVKLIEDALTGYAYRDDCQIARQLWEDCGADRLNPRVEITIQEMEAP